MAPLQVIAVPPVAVGQEPSPEIAACAELWRDVQLEVLGHDDLTESPPTLAVAYAQQEYQAKQMLLARRGETVVGSAYLGLPLKDNTTVAVGDLSVRPGADVRAVLTTLWDAARPRLVEHGRSTVQVWSVHRPMTPQQGKAWLLPRTGVGGIAPDTRTQVLQELGFVLEQVERHSQLDVDEGLGRAVTLEAGALARAAGYDVLSWAGGTPDHLLDGLADACAHMATDAPSGALEVGPEHWDADRVRYAEQSVAARGMVRVTTVAVDRRTGAVAAYTQIDHHPGRPAVAYQEDTLVLGEHRGHRLGMLVKIANLRALREEAPGVQRVHTWNAGENAWMLRINLALGFREASHEAAWQLTGLS